MTLLPNKHVPIRTSFLGLGAILLRKLEQPSSVSGLWERCRKSPDIASFERFAVTLDLLFVIGAVRLENDILVRTP